MKILLISDSHYDLELINKVLNKHYDCDYYWHLGDSQLDKYQISPFISVKGNCDSEDFDLEKDFVIDNLKIHLEHGHKIKGKFENYIKKKNCDIFIFGHTHEKMLLKVDNTIVINPGSLIYPRDSHNGSYAILEIENLKFKSCQFYEINLF